MWSECFYTNLMRKIYFHITTTKKFHFTGLEFDMWLYFKLKGDFEVVFRNFRSLKL